MLKMDVLRCLMQKAAMLHDVVLERISFKGSLDTIRQFANAATGAEQKPRTLAALVEEVLLAISRDLNPHRPGRSETRAKKRRGKNYRLLTTPKDIKWATYPTEESELKNILTHP
jgi:hypothetical protein